MSASNALFIDYIMGSSLDGLLQKIMTEQSQGVFPGGDLTDAFLTDVYERIKGREFKTGLDHVSQVR